MSDTTEATKYVARKGCLEEVYSLGCVQLCSMLYDLMDCSRPDSSVHGIFWARILEQVAISYSRVSSRPRDPTHISCVSCFGRQILLLLSHLWSSYLVHILEGKKSWKFSDLNIHLHEWIKKMWYVYVYTYSHNEMLLSHKVWNNTICSNTDGPRGYRTQWN